MSCTKNERIVYALSLEELQNPEIADGLWHAVREIRQLIPRRQFPTRIYSAISEFPGKLLELDGSPYIIPEDQEIFGNDADFRWLDNCYLALDAKGERLYRKFQNPERVRILDVYFQIAFPMSIARHYR